MIRFCIIPLYLCFIVNECVSLNDLITGVTRQMQAHDQVEHIQTLATSDFIKWHANFWDERTQMVWRELWNMDLAAKQTSEPEMYIEKCLRMKEFIWKQHKRNGFVTISKESYKATLPTIRYPTNLAWMGILHYLVDILRLHSDSSKWSELRMLEACILEKGIIYLNPKAHKQSRADLEEFVNYAIHRIGTYVLFRNWGMSFKTTGSNIYVATHAERNLKLLEDAELIKSCTCYGEAYWAYMNFIDLVHHLLTAGFKSKRAIMAMQPCFWGERRWQSRLSRGQTLEDFKSINQYAFGKLDLPRKWMSGEEDLLLKNPLHGIEPEFQKMILDEIAENSYFALDKGLNLVERLQNITSGKFDIQLWNVAGALHIQGDLPKLEKLILCLLHLISWSAVTLKNNVEY
ncbi:hypothetical protein CROQUDRAFT_694325 [Cronartium quercuum f. sp. fusiforme G11]|uniref:Uncharacterized protein n=1 Tax=Cronartium quercuum f. sp. fusiforme G11 TaxID=708437 RepID=A0A9P6NQJ7_9BASI|nr:hypothetical protein CROQUDRAFT_694325 [Cronartium quercuum f. sp. fusiforme G11]